MNRFLEYFKTDVLLPTASRDNEEELKTFGLTFAIAIPLIFTFVLPWIFSHQQPYWPFGISMALLAGYFFKPVALYYPYRCWMFVGSILAWLNTKLILALAYFLMIIPIGLVLQLLGKLDYNAKPTGKSYWITPRTQSSTRKQRLKEPF